MTTRTLTAIYDHYDDAAKAVAKLEAAGVPHNDISLVSNKGDRDAGTDAGTHDTPTHEAANGAGTGATLGTVLGGGAGLLAGLGLLAIPGVGPVVAAGWLVATLTGAGIGAAAGGLTGSLTGAGLSETDAHAYAEGVRRGGTLLTVRTDEARTEAVSTILEEHGAVDLDERQQGWKQEGWTGVGSGATSSDTSTLVGSQAAAGSTAGHAGTVATDRTTTDTYQAKAGAAAGSAAVADTDTIPVVQESLTVGKREVNQGRVRVHSYAVETPVSEHVTLRDETVHVDRQAVDRPLTEADDVMFVDKTIEAAEHREQAVVSKDARVVEEIGIRKDATQRTETVSDTVRRTEVEIEDERGNVSHTGSSGTTTTKPV